jgi:hypothetical protein
MQPVPLLDHRRQGGFATLVVVSILALLSLSMLSMSSLTMRQALWQQEERMAQDVQAAAEQLQLAYELQWISLAAPLDPPWTEVRLRDELTQTYGGMRLAMSERITAQAAALCTAATTLRPDCIPSRRIMIWHPASTDIADWSLTQGLPLAQLGADAIGRIHDTRNWDIAQYAQAQAQIERVGILLSSYFKARQAADPRLPHGINWWRSPSCSAADEHYLPCVNTYTPLSTSGVAEALGIGIQDTQTPYGEIEFSNQTDASLTSPYSVALRVQTPFGVPMRKTVIAP